MKSIFNTKKKTIVIDDAGYLITNYFMKRHSNAGAGNAIFGLYNELADHFWLLVDFVVNKVADDKIVYFIMHEDKNDFGDVRPKTIGKLLDEKVDIAGMFTIVLRCLYEDNKHIFKTQSDGLDVCKTPLEMFENIEIENDLKFVDKTIRKYYEIESEEIKNEKTK